jgi:hypothetical protein
MEMDYLQSVFERAVARIAGQGFCNPTPRTEQQLTALLDAKIEKQNQRKMEKAA